MPKGRDTKLKLHHVWVIWTKWGVDNAAKRKTLLQLGVSDQVTSESRQAALKMAAPTVELVADASARGVLADQPAPYVGALVESTVYTTMDFMIANPRQAKKLSEAGFEALWRLLT